MAAVGAPPGADAAAPDAATDSGDSDAFVGAGGGAGGGARQLVGLDADVLALAAAASAASRARAPRPGALGRNGFVRPLRAEAMVRPFGRDPPNYERLRQLLLGLILSVAAWVGVVTMAFYEQNQDTRAILIYFSLGMLVVVYKVVKACLAYQARLRSFERHVARSIRGYGGRGDALRRLLGGRGGRMLALAAMDRDFDANDYERLLTLDDDTPTLRRQGASQAQVNRLPTYTFRSKAKAPASSPGGSGKDSSATEDGKTCRVCLCEFEDGDSIRIIPCFHQFHQECIDRWLLQKAECPVCKAPARGNDDASRMAAFV